MTWLKWKQSRPHRHMPRREAPTEFCGVIRVIGAPRGTSCSWDTGVPDVESDQLREPGGGARHPRASSVDAAENEGHAPIR